MGFADDWMILTSHKHVRRSENRIQKALNQITKWADNTCFQISTEKTKSILFIRKRYQSANRPTINIWIKGQRIQQVNQHRILLGLIFDARMTWNEHGRGASDEIFRQDTTRNLESTKNQKKNTATKHDLQRRTISHYNSHLHHNEIPWN
jgi:hypothetical protein